MSTLKQIEANRLNALKSTGPRTTAGKSITRQNALKHGIFADAPLLTGENNTAFESLRDSYLDRFDPATPEELTLLTSIVGHAWLLARFPRVESHMWNDRMKGSLTPSEFPLSRAHSILFKQLDALQRRINCTERHFRQDLELLMKLQAARKDAAPPPGPILQAQPAEPVASEIGSVPATRKAPRNRGHVGAPAALHPVPLPLQPAEPASILPLEDPDRGALLP